MSERIPVRGYGTTEDIAKEWLRLCGCCDAGLPMGCTCPGGDPRAVIMALLETVESLWKAPAHE